MLPTVRFSPAITVVFATAANKAGRLESRCAVVSTLRMYPGESLKKTSTMDEFPGRPFVVH
jgi:hypothetical protein